MSSPQGEMLMVRFCLGVAAELSRERSQPTLVVCID